MRLNNKILLFFIILLFLLPSVFSTGTCELDKDIYHPFESALFSCICNSPAEENRAGFIVFQNSSTNLQNISINSGSCTTSTFGDTFDFPSGSEYLGNATFSLNSDGTGVPPNWGNGDDIISDDFNVTGPDSIDCIILFEDFSNTTFELGELGAWQLNVIDGVTTDPLIEANCHVHIFDVQRRSILQTPHTPPTVSLKTSADGEVLFDHVLSEKLWTVNTTYILEGNCFCTLNQTDSQCYIGNNSAGISAGYKECVAETLIITGIDQRDTQFEDGISMLGYILVSFIIISFFMITGLTITHKSKLARWTRFGSITLAYLQIIYLVFLIWLNESGIDPLSLFRMNFWIVTLIGFGLLMFALFLQTIELMRLDTTESEDEDRMGKREW